MAGGGRLLIVSVILLIAAVAGYFYFNSSLTAELARLKAADGDTDTIEKAISAIRQVAIVVGILSLVGVYFGFSVTRKAMNAALALLVVSVVAIAYPYIVIATSEDIGSFDDMKGVAKILHLWLPIEISLVIFSVCTILVKSGSSGLLTTLGNICAGISTWVGKLASWIVLPLVAIIMIDVITRKIEYIKVRNAEITETYGFSVSFILQDFQWHLHGVLLLLTFGFGYIMNSHVRVDIFRETASHRGQVKIETLGLTFLAIPFMLVMIGFSWDLTYASWRIGEGSESMVGLGMRYIIKSFLIWGFTIALLAALGTLFRCVNFLFGDADAQADANEKLQFFTDTSFLPKVVLEDEDGDGGDGPNMNNNAVAGGH